MSSSTSMTVALVLTAVNNMPSALNNAGRNVQTFASQISKAGDEVNRYDQKIKNLETSMNNFSKLKTSGLQSIQGGMAMLVPVEEMLRQAANFEGVMTKVENALYDANIPLVEQQERMQGLTDQALELGAITTFNNMEAAQAQLALIKNGMAYQDVLDGGAQAALYLAQTAEIAPTAAGDAVSQITNMFQLQGSELLQVADDINRAANASSAGVGDIMNDLQQTGMTAKTLGLEVGETTLLLGTLHNLGLGDSSGTYLNNMLINLDKITPKARTALQNMGWLEGATVKTLSSGKISVSGGTNSLFDEQGQIRSAEMLVQKLREVLYTNSGIKPEDMRDKYGNLLPQEEIEELLGAKNKLIAMQQFKDVFGVQGMRAAIALATPGKGSYEQMVTQAERAQSIQNQVLSWQETLLGKVETLKGSWETIMTQSGTPLTNEVGVMVQQTIDFVNAVGDFANEHPKLVTGMIKLFGAFAIGKIIIGGGKFLFGDLGIALTKASKVLTYAARSAHGFYDAFKYFRNGSGIFRSLWQAVAFGRPILTRVLSIVGRFGGGLVRLGGQALAMGARMAVAWLIGLGPIGWIILGVTALIAAGIVAWKTNFMGFRDFMLELFNRIGELVLGVFASIIEKAEGMLELVNKAREFLGMDPLEIEAIDNAKAWIESAQNAAESSKPKPKPVDIKGGNDNRQYNINIQSTDPKEAAKEVSQKLSSPLLDKYTQSRDPRLDLGFSIP